MEVNITYSFYKPPFLFTIDQHKKEIINYFNISVESNTFLIGSSDDKKIIGYSVGNTYQLLEEVAGDLSRELSLNITACSAYCGGPIYGLMIKDND